MNIKINNNYEKNEREEIEVKSVLVLNKELLNVLEENGISLDDVQKEMLKAQNQTLYKLLCKEKDYKGFYEYVKTLIYKNAFNESLITSKLLEVENE